MCSKRYVCELTPSFSLIFAPFFSKISTTFICPIHAATCRGVSWFWKREIVVWYRPHWTLSYRALFSGNLDPEVLYMQLYRCQTRWCTCSNFTPHPFLLPVWVGSHSKQLDNWVFFAHSGSIVELHVLKDQVYRTACSWFEVCLDLTSCSPGSIFPSSALNQWEALKLCQSTLIHRNWTY